MLQFNNQTNQKQRLTPWGRMSWAPLCILKLSKNTNVVCPIRSFAPGVPCTQKLLNDFVGKKKSPRNFWPWVHFTTRLVRWLTDILSVHLGNDFGKKMYLATHDRRAKVFWVLNEAWFLGSQFRSKITYLPIRHSFFAVKRIMFESHCLSTHASLRRAKNSDDMTIIWTGSFKFLGPIRGHRFRQIAVVRKKESAWKVFKFVNHSTESAE